MISSRLVVRSGDISLFAQTRYSFEEWCNWEALAACAIVPGWRVHRRPMYRDLGVADSREYGDLMVTRDGTQERVLMELGIVHDGTGDKWIGKLNRDAAKVTRITVAAVVPLHLILLVSFRDVIETASNWKRWLSRVECWQRPGYLQSGTSLPHSGQMVLRGWIGGRT